MLICCSTIRSYGSAFWYWILSLLEIIYSAFWFPFSGYGLFTYRVKKPTKNSNGDPKSIILEYPDFWKPDFRYSKGCFIPTIRNQDLVVLLFQMVNTRKPFWSDLSSFHISNPIQNQDHLQTYLFKLTLLSYMDPSQDSSICSISAWYWGGPGFKCRQGQEFFSENK